eukprot:EG_transcript_12325
MPRLPVLLGLLLLLLGQGRGHLDDLTTPCERDFFPGVTPKLERLRSLGGLTRCPKMNETWPWAPPVPHFGGSVELAHGWAKCRAGVACAPNATHVPPTFVIEDVTTVGHMIMSFTSLFSFMAAAPPNSTVMVVWGRSPATSDLGSLQIRRQFFVPLLRQFGAYFARRKRLRYQTLDTAHESDSGCYNTPLCAIRNCVYQQPASPHICCSGHCGSWFASPAAVGEWRGMLHLQYGVALPLQNCRDDWRGALSVLIYDRPPNGARSFKNPYQLRKQVYDHLRAAWPNRNLLVQSHSFLETDFETQCQLFAQFDMIVMVHGSGLVNLVCARPCAMVIEVAWWYQSIIQVLAAHTALHHCYAQVADHQLADPYHHFSNSPAIEVKNLTSCLDRFVLLHSSPQGNKPFKSASQSHSSPAQSIISANF